MIIAFLATIFVACGDKAEDSANTEEVKEQTDDTAAGELEEEDTGEELEEEDTSSETEGEE